MDNTTIFTTETDSYRLTASYQYRENYGFDWSGKGKHKSYWKCKGGHDEILADGVTAEMLKCPMFMDRMRQIALDRQWSNDMSSADFMGFETSPSALWLDESLINADHHYDYSTLCLWEPNFEMANHLAEYPEYRADDNPESWERYETLAELAN